MKKEINLVNEMSLIDICHIINYIKLNFNKDINIKKLYENFKKINEKYSYFKPMYIVGEDFETICANAILNHDKYFLTEFCINENYDSYNNDYSYISDLWTVLSSCVVPFDILWGMEYESLNRNFDVNEKKTYRYLKEWANFYLDCVNCEKSKTYKKNLK